LPAQDKPGPAKLVMPYQAASTAALDAKEAVETEAADHTRLRVEFNGIKGDRVPAFLYLPKLKDKRVRPAILLQYGIGGNRKTDYIVSIGKQFVASGFVVLTIDAPGVGERRTKEKKVPAILGLLGGDQVMHYCGDYSRAMDFLVTRAEVDKERLGFVGISWGAITGITYVAWEARVKAMASLVGGGNFLGQYSPDAAAKAAREGSKSSDPVFHVARISPRPLLFINVTKDQLIPRPWSEALHKAAGPGAKVVWLETDHYFKGLDRDAVCRSVIEFMERGLSVKR
jgi:dienelactone hydrolase